VGRYKIYGDARFLSHQETMRVIVRSLIRSRVGLIYSQGYNPHPRFSLPLPRNVGLASDNELFCVKVQTQNEQQSEDFSFAVLIAKHLPSGFELMSVVIHSQPVTYRPVEVEYLVKVDLQDKTQQFFSGIENLSERIRTNSEIMIERAVDQKGFVKTVDVAKFLKSFDITQHGISVFCRVLPTGTIRPDEILRLLRMEPKEISGSIIRKKITWQVDI
jgi:radical SAM-linked protein